VVGRTGTCTCYPAFGVLSASIDFRVLPAQLYIASVASYPAIQAIFFLHERAFHLMARSILAHHSISLAKSDPEIKKYFRVRLIADIRIKIKENPANDNLSLYEYINKAVRFEQILDHITNISGLPRDLYARKGQINVIARVPRRKNLQFTYR
jgi:hypothetical protein